MTKIFFMAICFLRFFLFLISFVGGNGFGNLYDVFSKGEFLFTEVDYVEREGETGKGKKSERERERLGETEKERKRKRERESDCL